MSRIIRLWESIIKDLTDALEIIDQPDQIETTKSLLWNAYDTWNELTPHAHKSNEAAMDLYLLHDYLSEYREKPSDPYDTSSLKVMRNSLETIISIVNNKKDNVSRDNIFGDDESDQETDDEDDVITPITKEGLLAKINSIFNNIDLTQNFYQIKNKISAEELNTSKWKTYLYLRKCVLEYRAGNTQELVSLIQFLEKSNKNKKWLADRLLDATDKGALEKWGSGQHEWLERCLIIDVLKRSAGITNGVQTETTWQDGTPNADWLYVQAQLRTPTKFIFFKNAANTIKNGHPGAVKKQLDEKGFCNSGSHGFHQKLIDAFNESTSLAGFIKRVHNVFKRDVYSGKRKFNADDESRFLVDGTKTDDEAGINQSARKKLRRQSYDRTNGLLKGLLTTTAQGMQLDQFSGDELTSSDSSEDDNPAPIPVPAPK